jgi:hypothetical protein
MKTKKTKTGRGRIIVAITVAIFIVLFSLSTITTVAKEQHLKEVTVALKAAGFPAEIFLPQELLALEAFTYPHATAEYTSLHEEGKPMFLENGVELIFYAEEGISLDTTSLQKILVDIQKAIPKKHRNKDLEAITIVLSKKNFLSGEFFFTKEEPSENFLEAFTDDTANSPDGLTSKKNHGHRHPVVFLPLGKEMGAWESQMSTGFGIGTGWQMANYVLVHELLHAHANSFSFEGESEEEEVVHDLTKSLLKSLEPDLIQIN